MKFQVSILKYSFIFLLLGVASVSGAQGLKIDVAKDIVSSKQFTFRAQTALPTSGPAVQLTTPYDLRLIKDSMVAYLPYYGRAYSASYSNDGGIKFNSNTFEYKAKERKKGGWDISISPKGLNDIRQLYMTVFANGSATLQVISSNRQPITFQGYITNK